MAGAQQLRIVMNPIIIVALLLTTVLVGGVWVGVASANPVFLGTSGGATAAADETAPTLSTFVIGTDGDTWTFTYDENVTATDDGDMCDGYAVTMSTAGALTFTYGSGTRGSTNVFTCTGSATVNSGETITAGLDYTQGTIADTSTNALAAIDDKTSGFTNNSTQSSGNSDSFTDTNGTALATHDSNWVNANATWTVANFNIQSNTARPVDAWSTAGARYTGSNGDVSQIVYKGGWDGDVSTSFAAVRMNGTTLGYGCTFGGASGGNWTTVDAVKNGNYLDTALTGGTWSQAADHTVRVRASGTSPVTVYCSVDGGAEGSAVDSTSPYATGLSGFVGYQDGDSGDSIFDDWTDQ